MQLPIGLVEAIAQVESGGAAGAIRVEPAYRWLWDVREQRPFRLSAEQARSSEPPPDFPALPGTTPLTEYVGQRTSWGALQVMGAVARELGFRGHFGELAGPVGAYYGGVHLRRLAERFGAAHGLEGVIAAYNAGSPRRDEDGAWVNAGYVAKVLRALNALHR